MKCCINARGKAEYIKKANEIKVEYRDRNAIPDLYEKYPDAEVFILECYEPVEEIEWSKLKNLSILCKDKLVLCCGNIQDCKRAKSEGFKFYLGYPISTFFELRAIINMGVSYVRLGMPLFFMRNKVIDVIGESDIKIRAVPNVAYIDGLPRKNGIHGQWIRPEDLDLYENFVYVIEFEDCDADKEGALYRIYMEEKEWPGEINMLISNFGESGVNRMLDKDFTLHRMNCGQRCEERGNCHICDLSVGLCNVQKITEYKESTEL